MFNGALVNRSVDASACFAARRHITIGAHPGVQHIWLATLRAMNTQLDCTGRLLRETPEYQHMNAGTPALLEVDAQTVVRFEQPVFTSEVGV